MQNWERKKRKKEVAEKEGKKQKNWIVEKKQRNI